MALQKPMELSTGIVLDNSYHRLTSVILDYINKNFQLVVSIFVNQQMREEGKNQILTNYYTNSDRETFDEYFSIESLNQSGQNPVERGYVYLKSLPDYQDGVDI